MAQYRIGTVAVTEGSAVVTGTGTAWAAEIIAGQTFSLYRSGVAYTIATVNSDDQITLSAPYAGPTAVAQAYQIVRDFTPYYDIPYPDYGDVDTAAVFREAMLRIEQAIVAQDTGLNIAISRKTVVAPVSPAERVNYILPARYTAGTVAVAQGSAIVTGAGTAWVGALWPGMVMTLELSGGTAAYTIASVDGDDQVTLTEAVGQAGQTGVSYAADCPGVWAGQGPKIAVWDGGAWKYITPADGWRLYVKDEAYVDYIFDGGIWQPGPYLGAAVIAAGQARDDARAWASDDGIIADGLKSAKAFAADAGGAAQAAAGALTAIGTSVDDAAAARDGAVVAADEAAGAVVAATAARDGAVAAAADAATALADALASKDDAVAAAGGAAGAVAAAELAQAGAEVAQAAAEDWAEKTSGPVTLTPDVKYSAKHHAGVAAAIEGTVAGHLATIVALASTTSGYRDAAQAAAGSASAAAGTATQKSTESANSAATSNQAAVDAVNAKTDAVDARNAALAYRDATLGYRVLAQNYANYPHGVQVEAGTYSAYHYMVEAQGYAQTAATIVGGQNFGIIGDGIAARFSASGPGSVLNLVQGAGISMTWNPAAWSVTFAFAAGTVDHQALANTGVATHADIDAHLTDGPAHLPDSAGASAGTVVKRVGGEAVWAAVDFADLTGRPTTRAGYGITDAADAAALDDMAARLVRIEAAQVDAFLGISLGL